MQSSEPDRKAGTEEQFGQQPQGGSGRGASTALAWLKLRESEHGACASGHLTDAVVSADAALVPPRSS